MPRAAASTGRAASSVASRDKAIDEIARKLNTTKATITSDIASGSPGFLNKVLAILNLRGITSYDDWEPILAELTQLRERRRMGGAGKPGVSRANKWQPWEADEVLRSHAPQGQSSGQGSGHSSGHNPAHVDALLPPSPMSGSSIDGDSFVAPPPDTHVIFCGMGTFEDLASSDQDAMYTRISFLPSDKAKAGKALGRLTSGDLMEIEEQLGRGLCCNYGQHELQRRVDKARQEREKQTGKKNKTRRSTVADDQTQTSEESQTSEYDEVVYIHQAVVNMLWAEATGRVKVTWRHWDWVQQQLESNTLLTSISDIEAARIILLTPFDRLQWDNLPDVRQFYDTLKFAPPSVSTYPSETEMFGMSSQLQDVQAFDALASESDTPREYSYRPRTCIGHGPCALEGYTGQVAYKRTFATSKYNPTSEATSNAEQRARLKCTGSVVAGGSRGRGGGGSSGHSYHQEFICTIKDWGKCRVWMAGDKVLEIGLTQFQEGNQDWQTFALDPKLAFGFLDRSPDPCSEAQGERNEKRREKKLEELKRYCRWWRKNLMLRNPQLFASFEVGVRFDVCISEMSRDARFFILAAKRWPAADSIGDSIVGYPYDFFCEAFGTRFSEIHGTLISAAAALEGEEEDLEEEDLEEEE